MISLFWQVQKHNFYAMKVFRPFGNFDVWTAFFCSLSLTTNFSNNNDRPQNFRKILQNFISQMAAKSPPPLLVLDDILVPEYHYQGLQLDKIQFEVCLWRLNVQSKSIEKMDAWIHHATLKSMKSFKYLFLKFDHLTIFGEVWPRSKQPIPLLL
jgi:hypothetical protein